MTLESKLEKANRFIAENKDTVVSDYRHHYPGSAIEKDGKLYLVYTGHVVEEDVVYQRQCIAVSEDGIHFEKSHQNPVIEETILGKNSTIHDFRDPKVFVHDGMYYSVVATKSESNHGRILLFSSRNLIDWQFYSVMLAGDDQQGIMWECPDFFTLDGKDVLIMSPIQIPKRGYEFHNISSTIAFIGKMNWDSGKFQIENNHEIDGGLDFYAPQTLEDDQGRRIMIAWMQMWDRTLPTHTLGHKWSGAMTLPRQLRVEKNHLVQKPVELVYETIAIDHEISELSVSEEVVLTEEFNENVYLKFEADFSESTSFKMQLAKNAESALVLSYEKDEQLLTLSRENLGYAIIGNEDPVLFSRSMVVPLVDQQIVLELFRDTSSLEVFVNETQSMTMTFYEKQKGRDVVVNSQGTTRLSHIKEGHLLV